MKNILVCIKCGKEFMDIAEAGEHSREEEHYIFTIKGIIGKELGVMFA